MRSRCARFGHGSFGDGLGKCCANANRADRGNKGRSRSRSPPLLPRRHGCSTGKRQWTSFWRHLYRREGQVEINRGRFACNPATLLSPFEGEESKNHVGNWLDCIESREEPNAPVEVGHLISSVAHLINICRIRGRTINWDSTQEQIIGDESANALLNKERRPEYSIPDV